VPQQDGSARAVLDDNGTGPGGGGGAGCRVQVVMTFAQISGAGTVVGFGCECCEDGAG